MNVLIWTLCISLSFFFARSLEANAISSCDLMAYDPECEGLSLLVDQIDQRSNAHQNFIKKVKSAYDPDSVKSVTNAHCKALKDPECEDVLGTSPISDFARSSLKIPFFQSPKRRLEKQQSIVMSSEEKAKCACVESSMALQLNGDFEELDKIINEKSKNVSDEVIKAFGKKVINEYAHVYEDGMYFLNHSNVVSPKKAEDILCRGAGRFEKMINKKCPHKDPVKVKERMKMLFFSMDFSGLSSLDEKLNYIDYNTVHRKAKSKNGEELTYLRNEYDKTRYGLKHTREFRILDKMLTNLLTSKDIDLSNEKIMFRSGVEVIASELSELFVKDFEGTISRIFNNQVPKQYLDEWRQVKSGPNAYAEFTNRFTRYFFKVAPSHPGLSAILLDSTLFSEFRDHARKKNITSVFHELENNFDEIEDYMISRCKTMVDDFSDVVCMEDEQILNGLSKDSLSDFVDQLDLNSHLAGMKDVLTCRGGLNNVPGFKDLNSEGKKIVNSDFFIYSNNKQNSSDAYSLFARELASNKETGSLISYAAQFSDASPTRKSSYNPFKRFQQELQGDKMIDSSGAISKREFGAKEKITERTIDRTSSLASMSAQEKLSQSLAFNQPFKIASQNQSVKEEFKEIIRDLSQHRDVDQIDSHLANMDYSDLEQLKQFKDSALSEKEESLKQRLEEEKQNLEQLQARIDSLSASQTIIEGSIEKRNTKPIDEEDIIQEREPNKLTTHEGRDTYSANRPSQVDSRAFAPTSQNSGVASLNSSSFPSAASRSPSSIESEASSPQKSSPTGLVVQSQEGVVNNQELTQKIVDYLKSVDGETLLRFTKEGVTYRYKVVEGGKIVEKEIHVSMNDIDPLTLEEIARESATKLNEMKRKYSYQALRVVISEEILK